VLILNSIYGLVVDDLIIRFLQDKATTAEVEQLREWRQQAIGNERHYREVARVWRLTEALRRGPTASRAPSAAELLSTGARSPRRAAARRSRLVPLAAAALLLVGLGIGRHWRGVWADTTFAATELVTGAEELVTARLGDGSVVRLAPSSRLRITYHKGHRDVWLDGQAFFAVASRPEPFLVRTRAGEALVLGTRFLVGIHEDSLQLMVVEGRVALSASGQRVEIAAGQASHVVSGATPRVETVHDPGRYLAWMDEALVSESVPLREVVQEIERRYVVRVELRDSLLAERTVTARFTRESLEDVLSITCRVVRARCSIHGSVVSIEP
jgi:transmembrane sensor